MFAETWAAAADALSRDPALALAPLRALRHRRFVRPHPGANGWPDAAVPTLFAALDASRSCAAASPTLAGELWGAAAGLLAAWARWHAPRVVHSANDGASVGTAAAAGATLSRVVDVVARDVFRASNDTASHTHDSTGLLPEKVHVPGGPLGASPALCLACVAASPAAPRATRARALASALEALALAEPRFAFAAPADARALAASLAYACEAAADIHRGDVGGEAAFAEAFSRAFFPLWRSDGARLGETVGEAGEASETWGAAASAASAAAQRAGLLCVRAAHATARRSFPRIAASLARTARDATRPGSASEPFFSGVSPGHAGAAFVAAGVLLACRRPFFDEASPEGDFAHAGSIATKNALDVDALRVAETRAAEAVEAAARVSASLAADDALADAVAETRRPPRVGFAVGASATRTASLRAAWAALAAGALSASRCLAERAFDAESFARDETRRDGERAKKQKRACFFAVVSASFRFASAPLAALRKCAVSGGALPDVDPASASAAAAAARSAPLAARAHALIDLACEARASDVARDARGADASREEAAFLARATARFARETHEEYAAFLAATPARWRGALDPAATRLAFAEARLAATVACDRITAIALDGSSRDDADGQAPGVSLLVAACDALARVEFARGFSQHKAFDAAAQTASTRYALALTRLAAALGADSATGAAFRERFALDLVPEAPTGPSMGTAELKPGRRVFVDALFDARANVFLRLAPYAASGAFGDAPGGLLRARVAPLAAHHVSHPSPARARAAHVALAAVFRAAPGDTVPEFFPPYVERSLERLYDVSVGAPASSAEAAEAGGAGGLAGALSEFTESSDSEAFAATVFVVAECGGGTAESRAAVAAAARALVERAARLDAAARAQAARGEKAVSRRNEKNARTLRRLVFSSLPLVDHALVPDVQRAAEEAVLRCADFAARGSRGLKAKTESEGEGGGGEPSPRLAAYADLARSVMAIGDVARKGAATRWALQLRARI